jgi:hypothetical protein
MCRLTNLDWILRSGETEGSKKFVTVQLPCSATRREGGGTAPRAATCYDRGTTGTPLPLAPCFDRQAASVLVVLHLACMLICLRFIDHAEED